MAGVRCSTGSGQETSKDVDDRRDARQYKVPSSPPAGSKGLWAGPQQGDGLPHTYHTFYLTPPGQLSRAVVEMARPRPMTAVQTARPAAPCTADTRARRLSAPCCSLQRLPEPALHHVDIARSPLLRHDIVACMLRCLAMPARCGGRYQPGNPKFSRLSPLPSSPQPGAAVGTLHARRAPGHAGLV